MSCVAPCVYQILGDTVRAWLGPLVSCLPTHLCTTKSYSSYKVWQMSPPPGSLSNLSSYRHNWKQLYSSPMFLSRLRFFLTSREFCFLPPNLSGWIITEK